VPRSRRILAFLRAYITLPIILVYLLVFWIQLISRLFVSILHLFVVLLYIFIFLARRGIRLVDSWAALSTTARAGAGAGAVAGA